MACIEVVRVSKFYKLYEKPIERLKEILGLKAKFKTFWALKDVSFEVAPGETVGIIGLNGSGKSTLLQIIAGTVTPSSGHVKVNGRVAALLELGIGFHPELTGRENVRLASSLMGVPYYEHLEREIESFAEIGEFFDQPVKTYSSGMFVRLAFALAVSVDPDILIIDEALSVGDHYFQKKSFDRILEFKKRGKTLLFCSHSMYHVTHLCDRAIWLHKGEIKMQGDTLSVVREYESWVRKLNPAVEDNKKTVQAPASVHLTLLDKEQKEREVFSTGEAIVVSIEYSSQIHPCHISVGIGREDGLIVYATSTQLDEIPPIEKSKASVKCIIDSNPLLPGEYSFHGVVLDETGNVVLGRAVKSVKIMSNTEEIGVCRIDHSWEIG